jgi:hypothetical protein
MISEEKKSSRIQSNEDSCVLNKVHTYLNKYVHIKILHRFLVVGLLCT